MNTYPNNSERPAINPLAVALTRHFGQPINSGFDLNERPVRVSPESTHFPETLDEDLAAYLAMEDVVLGVPSCGHSE